jgi:hypothetical protein
MLARRRAIIRGSRRSSCVRDPLCGTYSREWWQHEFLESAIVHDPFGLGRCGIQWRSREARRCALLGTAPRLLLNLLVGRASQSVSIHRQDGYLYLDHIRLIVELETDLFFTCDGEAVDSRHGEPTCGNIRLRRVAAA